MLPKTHATTKFKWFYMHENGSESWGALIVPIGEEDKIHSHLEKILSEALGDREKFDKTRLAIVEIGDDKLR